jgi:transposase-like protein
MCGHGTRSASLLLLNALTKTVLETALNEELIEHLGSGKHRRCDGRRQP